MGFELQGYGHFQHAIRLRLQQSRAMGQPRYTVGYDKSYAVYVHENLEAHHPVGQAKFLEQPARVHTNDMKTIISKSIKAGKTVRQAVLWAAQFLLRKSKELVPVDTGELKKSGVVFRES